MIKEPRKNERKYKENNFTQKNPLQTFIIKKKKKNTCKNICLTKTKKL